MRRAIRNRFYGQKTGTAARDRPIDNAETASQIGFRNLKVAECAKHFETTSAAENLDWRDAQGTASLDGFRYPYIQQSLRASATFDHQVAECNANCHLDF